MTRGRKPKPDALKKLHGSTRPTNPDAPKVKPARPRCPQALDKKARAEWRRVVPELAAAGLLSQIDRAALAAYCAAWSRWITAEDELRQTSAVVKSPSGYPIQNPWLAIANKALEQVAKFASEFGMTPASRTRVAAAKPDKPGEGVGGLLKIA